MHARRNVLFALCIILFIYFEIHSCSQDHVAGPIDPGTPVESIILSATDIYFYDASFGCVTGCLGTLMKTDDGGETWTGELVDQGILSDIEFHDPSTGWLAGKDGALYTTVDGGSTWVKPSSTGYPPEEDFSKLHFVNDSIGFVLGYRGVYRTMDAGASWENNWLPDVPYRGAWDMSFVDDRTGYLLGSRYSEADPAILYRTTDGAATWFEVPGARTSVLQTVLTICFINATTGWAGGGVIMKTADGGETWQTVLPRATVREFQFLDERCGFAVGGKTILRTRDGGDTWQNVTPEDSRIIDLRGVCFIDAERGWIVGRGQDEQVGEKLYKHTVVLKTSDGGERWRITDFPYDCTEVRNVEEAVGR